MSALALHGYTAVGDLCFALALPLAPDARTPAAAVARGGLAHVVRGPDALAFEFDDASGEVRVRIAPSPHELEGELVFRARTEALPGDARATRLGAWQGWLVVGAERVKLDASHVPGVCARETAAGGAALRAALHFDDAGAWVEIDASADVARAARVAPGAAPETLQVRHVSVTREPALVTLELGADRLALEPIVELPLRAVADGPPACAVWKLDELDPRAPENQRVLRLCRARWGERVGCGTLELERDAQPE